MQGLSTASLSKESQVRSTGGGEVGKTEGRNSLLFLVGEQPDPEGSWCVTCSSGTRSPSQVLPSNIPLLLQCGGRGLVGQARGGRLRWAGSEQGTGFSPIPGNLCEVVGGKFLQLWCGQAKGHRHHSGGPAI